MVQWAVLRIHALLYIKVQHGPCLKKLVLQRLSSKTSDEYYPSPSIMGYDILHTPSIMYTVVKEDGEAPSMVPAPD